MQPKFRSHTDSCTSNIKTTKKTRTVSCRLADNHPCQAVHEKKAENTRQSDASLGGSGLTAKQFLDRNPETLENNVKAKEFHAIISWQGSMQLIRI